MEITNMPLGRRDNMVEAGAIDGEMARIYSYGDAHPELVRVEESIMDFTFSLFYQPARVCRFSGCRICRHIRRQIPPGI